MVHVGEICSPRGTEGRGSVDDSMRRMAKKELDKDDPALLLKKECSVLFISEAAIKAMILVIMILVAMIWHQKSKQCSLSQSSALQ